MEPLVLLLYVSRASDTFDGGARSSMLASAQARNEKHQLTGALLLYGNRFMQVLEGPADEVQACFERIRADPRHSQVTEVARRPITARRFARWAMREVQMAPAPDRAVAAFLDGLAAAPTDEQVNAAIALLERLTQPG